MKKHLLLVIGCILVVITSRGQHSWKFRSDNYAGFAAGEMGSYGLFQTINGLYRGPWFLGLGTGLDYYRFRSVPVFLSVTRDLPVFHKRNGFFLDLNGGVNFAWYHPDAMEFGVVSGTWSPGIWGNAGLGYRWKFSERTDKGLLFKASYGIKELSEHDKEGPNPCFYCGLIYPGNSNTSTDYTYKNRMWLLSIGFQF